MGMCQALYAVLPALPAKGEAGPQISLGQQAAATGWGKWQQGGRLWQQTEKDIKMRIPYAKTSCNCLAD